MKSVSLLEICQFIQYVFVTCCSTFYEKYADIPLGNMIQRLTKVAAACF
jgi:hypothetical protein